MAREIRFRAWNEQKTCMIYDLQGEGNEDLFKRLGCPYAKEVKVTHDCVLRENEPDMGYYGGGYWDVLFDKECEFLQYTGLRDVNGKEVYEGDVLLDFFTGDYYEVVWDDSGAMFLFSNTNVDKSKKTGAIDYYEFEDECRGLGFAVAGNVYEHPDLGRTGIESTEQAQ